MAETIKVGLIGAGFIGASHARALHAMPVTFSDAPLHPVAHMLAEADDDVAANMARRLGFQKATGNWQVAVEACDAIVIAVPSHLHREIALAAMSLGKPVLCEKPVGLSAAEAEEIAGAATSNGVANAVGFTYARAPLVRYAVQLVRDGQLGRPLNFRGWHNEDYLADASAPFSWRLDPKRAGRAGAMGDLGWHILSLARLLCGRITALTGNVETFHKTRPTLDDSSDVREVGNEDWAAMLVEFETGARGTIECSRVAHGRKMDIGFELVCASGSIAFHGERMNQIEVFRDGNSGFETILCNASHPDFAAFIPAPGHGLGFNDLKTIEIRDFMVAIAENRGAAPDLSEAACIARLCEAALASHQSGKTVLNPETAPSERPTR